MQLLLLIVDKFCQSSSWKKAQGSGLTFNGTSTITSVKTASCSVSVGSCNAIATCLAGTSIKTGMCSGAGTGAASVSTNSFQCSFGGGMAGVSGTATAFCGT